MDDKKPDKRAMRAPSPEELKRMIELAQKDLHDIVNSAKKATGRSVSDEPTTRPTEEQSP